jgi:hypothetical protein
MGLEIVTAPEVTINNGGLADPLRLRHKTATPLPSCLRVCSGAWPPLFIQVQAEHILGLMQSRCQHFCIGRDKVHGALCDYLGLDRRPVLSF